MTRGPKKHLKTIHTPKSWMLSKMGGNWAVKTSAGPHQGREALPLAVLLKNRLKYALNNVETKMILNDKESGVKVDGKVRRDHGYPCGLMDVLSIEKTGENFRVLFDIKGRFILKSVNAEEAKFKLCKVKRRLVGPNKVPYVVTNDGRTIRYPHPDIKVNDTLQINLATGAVSSVVPFEIGNLAYVQSGNNVGRIGQITIVDRHPGSFDIVHIKDAVGNSFSTRLGNVFVIGQKKSLISVAKDNGIYQSAVEKLEKEKAAKKK